MTASTPAASPVVWRQGPATLYTGNAETVLTTLPDASIDCVVSSPPYWHLRDYHTGRWVGGDGDCDQHTSRQPRADARQPRCPACGAVWTDAQVGAEADVDDYVDRLVAVFDQVRRVLHPRGTMWVNLGDGYAGTGRPRANPPGATSITSPRYGREYHFDLDAIRIPARAARVRPSAGDQAPQAGVGKNPGDVWAMPTRAVREAHFASFPVELPRRCIAAGCRPGGTVLDPFSGTATTGLAALDQGCFYTGIDLNPAYTAIAQRRLASLLSPEHHHG